MNEFKWRESYAAYINLESREDREYHMSVELLRIGIEMERFDAYPWQGAREILGEDKSAGMVKRATLGAIGCYYSQMQVMKDALQNGKSAWVNEDDLIFCDDIKERLDYIQNYVNTLDSWDVIFLGGTWHHKPEWHKSVNGKHTHPDLQMCHCTLNKDWEPTTDKYIVRTYGAFCTYSYIVNVNSIEKILKMLDKCMSISMGIDWSFILMQPRLKCYAFAYGCVRQMDNQSDIGKGITVFSDFKHLGNHWFKNRVL